jgi:hypothetical protein
MTSLLTKENGMGFYSKTCAKSHLPVIASYKKGFPSLTNVVALKPDGTKMEGIYDGYGRLNDVDIYEKGNLDEWDKVKFVLKMHYEGESYEDLGKSGQEIAQGFFMDDQFLLFCVLRGKFKSYAEYKKYFKKYANW